MYCIREACALVDRLVIAIGVNPDKKPYFAAQERQHLLTEVLRSELSPEDFVRTEIVFIEHDLLVHFAVKVGATFLFRGIRNSKDYEYEKGMAALNSRLVPAVRTIFIPTPAKYAEVSSSMVKGLVGFNEWEQALSDWIHPVVLAAFKARVDVSRDA